MDCSDNHDYIEKVSSHALQPRPLLAHTGLTSSTPLPSTSKAGAAGILPSRNQQQPTARAGRGVPKIPEVEEDEAEVVVKKTEVCLLVFIHLNSLMYINLQSC